MTPFVVLPLPGNESMAASLQSRLKCELGRIETRKFPDGETYLKIEHDLTDRDAVLVCTLDRPDEKFLSLAFAADAARQLGASRVGLVAPYLAYMRQDRQFHSGEAVTSQSFARLLSETFSWLVTIDPHLHRYRSLADIYSVPAKAVRAAPLLAEWIGRHVENPVLIGPDAESVQWVADTAARIGASFTVLEKTRTGDRDVSVRLHDATAIDGHTPVLIDDIVSTGETMLAAIQAIRVLSAETPVCVAVHALFAEKADEKLAQAGARIVTCNTVAHHTNGIDVSAALAAGIDELLSRPQ
jgi:ribose-phosphate pyrophosphokinase